MGNLQVKINPNDSNESEYIGINNLSNETKLINGTKLLVSLEKKEKLVNFENKKKFILGIIDPQNDFLAGGALAVSNSNDILAPINKLRILCWNHMDTFISQDYHPSNHISFSSTHNTIEKKKSLTLTMDNGDIITVEQAMWPSHCVEGTKGCKFNKDLYVHPTDKIFRKGTKPNVESYSAFGDEYFNKYENTGLDNWLKSLGITDVVLVGIATDFCVSYTCLDALKLGYTVHLIKSCTRAVFEKKIDDIYSNLISKDVKVYEDVEDFINNNLKYF